MVLTVQKIAAGVQRRRLQGKYQQPKSDQIVEEADSHHERALRDTEFQT